MSSEKGIHLTATPRIISGDWFSRPALSAALFLCITLLQACGGGTVATEAPTPVTDTTPPTVTAVTPGNGDTGVALDAVLVATFSESMTAGSLTSATFLLADDAGAPVDGAVSASGDSATFTPATPLSGDHHYNATIKTAAKDMAGNSLASDFTWSFATAPAPDVTPPVVTATSPVNGDNAVALDATTTITLSEAPMSGTVNTGSFTLANAQSAPVAGAVSVAGNTATFTPSSQLSPGTTYTATLTTAVQDAAGNALASSYTWSFTTAAAVDTTPPTVTDVSPQDGVIDVALNASLSANFSEAVAPASVSGASFKVVKSGGATVAGTLSVSGVSVSFTPSASLAPSTAYIVTISTAVTDLSGNALAAPFSWGFTTGPAPDTTPPTISSTSPASGATGVALSAKVSATFSETMNNASLTTGSVTLAKTAGNVAVAGTVSVTGKTATFTPAAALAPSTGHTATVTTAAKDAAGNPLAANFTWTFTTGAAPDTTPPTVTATTPAANATNVSRSNALTVTFSEAMMNSTITATSFKLAQAGGGAVSGAVSISGNTASFTPAATLAAATQFTATVTTAAKDAAGNPLAANYAWSFTTAAAPDTTPPTVTSTSPADAATEIAVGSSVSATFSEPMNNATLTNASFTLQAAGGGGVAGSVSVTGNTVTLNPTANLAAGTAYTATITTAAKDVAGNALAANRVWSFTTAAAVVGTPALGAHTVAFKNDGSAGTVSSSSLATQSSGSTFLACTGRGVLAAQAPPTDNKGNTFTQLGSSHAYTNWPTSGTACYAAVNANGGAGHVITAPTSSGAPNDETTLALVEIKNGGVVKDFKWSEDLSSPLTSLSVTTTGPATLVAFWWGDGGTGVAHTATPNNGFTVVDSLLSMGALVQVSVATKNVAAAGTYNVTWTSTEGAQLWLMAIQ
jgi:hypothetical protein